MAKLYSPLFSLGFSFSAAFSFHLKRKSGKRSNYRLFDCRQMFCFSAAAMSSSR